MSRSFNYLDPDLGVLICVETGAAVADCMAILSKADDESIAAVYRSLHPLIWERTRRAKDYRRGWLIADIETAGGTASARFSALWSLEAAMYLHDSVDLTDVGFDDIRRALRPHWREVVEECLTAQAAPKWGVGQEVARRAFT